MGQVVHKSIAETMFHDLHVFMTVSRIFTDCSAGLVNLKLQLNKNGNLLLPCVRSNKCCHIVCIHVLLDILNKLVY